MVEMAHNFVGDAGAASLADCIAAKKSNLFLLDVEDNGIGLAGIQSVAAAAMGQCAGLDWTVALLALTTVLTSAEASCPSSA